MPKQLAKAESAARVTTNAKIAARKSGFATLEALYGWMQQSIMDGADAYQHDAAIAREIRPNSRQSAKRRMEIYSSDFFGRFHDVLAIDFDALADAMGRADWCELVDAFVVAMPSRTQIMNDYGYDLPGFLTSHEVANRHFLRDLATLQMEIARRYSTPPEAELEKSAIAALSPSDWETTNLRPRESADSYAFGFNVNRYLNDFQSDDVEPVVPANHSPTWMQIFARGDEVWRQPISQARHEALQALKRGESLAAALEAASAFADMDEKAFTDQIQGWFADWMNDGVFAAIERVES